MNTIGLWCIIFSAVLVAQIIGIVIGGLIMRTKWYKRWITKTTIEWTNDLMENYKETETSETVLGIDE